MATQTPKSVKVQILPYMGPHDNNKPATAAPGGPYVPAGSADGPKRKGVSDFNGYAEPQPLKFAKGGLVNMTPKATPYKTKR